MMGGRSFERLHGVPHMFDEVVVAIEGTEHDVVAVPVAAGIARQLDLPLSVLSIVKSSDHLSSRKQSLGKHLAKLGVTETAIQVLENGNIADTLVNQAKQRSGALFCLSTHARAPVGEAVFGSVAAETVRSAKVPVVLTGPRFSQRWGQRIEALLVCLDTSELSEAILPIAVDLAQRSGASLWLIEVLGSERMTMRTASDTAGEASYLRGEARRIHDSHGIEVAWDVLHGDDPGRAIADYARAMPGAMIAMTTHGRSGLSQVVAGSVAHRTVRHASCPVLMVRP
jgi:nucleotide-binding universal stress UspA family protein